MNSKTQNYIEAVAEYLARPRLFTDMLRPLRENIPDDEFTLEGHRFTVTEADFSDVMTFTKTRMISVRSADFPDMDALTVAYEPDFWGHKVVDTESRVEACLKLAENFVRNMLPKVDYHFKAMVHNDEVENILGVLE